MPEYDARVGQQRREGLFAVELPVTPAVGRGDLPAGAQHAFQLFGGERRQAQGQLRGLAGVTRQGRSGISAGLFSAIVLAQERSICMAVDQNWMSCPSAGSAKRVNGTNGVTVNSAVSRYGRYGQVLYTCLQIR